MNWELCPHMEAGEQQRITVWDRSGRGGGLGRRGDDRTGTARKVKERRGEMRRENTWAIKCCVESVV